MKMIIIGRCGGRGPRLWMDAAPCDGTTPRQGGWERKREREGQFLFFYYIFIFTVTRRYRSHACYWLTERTGIIREHLPEKILPERCVQDLCKMCARCVQGVRKMCARGMQDVCKVCSICVQYVCKVCSICVQDVCIFRVWYHWTPRIYIAHVGSQRNLKNLIESWRNLYMHALSM